MLLVHESGQKYVGKFYQQRQEGFSCSVATLSFESCFIVIYDFHSMYRCVLAAVLGYSLF